MAPNYDQRELSTLQDNFSRGIVGKVSPLGLKKGAPPTFVKSATNLLFRPARAMSVRPGCRDASQVVLPDRPVSLGKYYNSGGNRLFVAGDSGSNVGRLWRVSSNSRTLQTLPWTPTAQRWRFEMANGALVACQAGGAQSPIFYSPQNASDTWLSTILPAPAAAPTFNANAAGGSLAVTKDYFYRVRWNYRNGSSKAGPASAAHQAVAGSGNYTFSLNVPLPASPRADYVNWTLERTKQNGNATDGPWYRVADGTAATASDGASDASLFYEADETLHGSPVPMDGVIYHRGRLFGWYGSLLYMSQPVVGDEATGIFNWVGDAIFPVGKDDGDTIQSVVIQGERLLIGKRHSLWSLDGDDENSFRLVIRFEGAGFAGPEAAAALGPTVFFAATDRRFFVMQENAVKPVAAEEVGDYLDQMDTGRDAEIVAVNYLGDFILFWYVPKGHAYADELVAYDLKFGNWSHHSKWVASDAMVQKDTSDFSAATLLFADPTLRQPGSATTVATNPSYFAWTYAPSSTYQSFAQKVASDGTAAWGAGVQLSNNDTFANANAYYLKPFLFSDAAGAAIGAVHVDYRGSGNPLLFAQRVSDAGVRQWPSTNGFGTQVTNVTTAFLTDAQAVSDGAGGMYVCWCDKRGAAYKVYVQRLSSSGVVQWAANGVAPFNTSFLEACPRLMADGSGGCYVAAIISADGSTWSTKLARLDSTGAVVSGFPLVLGPNANTNTTLRMFSDGGGNVIVGWSSASTIYFQSVNSGGSLRWGASPLSFTATGGANESEVCSDGAGGAWVMWWGQGISSSYWAVYAQRVTSAGAISFGVAPVLWTALTASGDVQPQFKYNGLIRSGAIPDGNGGLIALWRKGATDSAVVGQRLNADGTLAWATPFITLMDTVGALDNFEAACTDGAGGAIVLASRPRAQLFRISPAGAITYGPLSPSGASTMYPGNVVFTASPEAEYPSGATAGYHVWCGFSGTRDFANADGSGGSLIPVAVEGHLYDDGEPNNTKDYDWFEVYVNRGYGSIIATITTDGGQVATLPLTTQVIAPQYNTGLQYNNGLVYATRGAMKIGRGIPKGTEGRAAKVALSGNIEDMEIGGWTIQGVILPRKDF